MPITASLGALTYDKSIAFLNTEYWMLQPTNTTSSFVDLTINSNNIFVLSEEGGAYKILSKILIDPPVIELAKSSTTIPYSIANDGNDFISVGTLQRQLTNVFPIQTHFVGTVTGITDTGNTQYPYPFFYPYNVPFGGNNRSLIFTTILRSTDGNYFVGQIDNSIIGVFEPGFRKFDANFVWTGAVRWGNVGSGSTTFINSLIENSTGNIISLVTNSESANTSALQIRLSNSTPNSNNSNTFDTVWAKQLRIANNRILGSDLSIDSNNNLYVTGYNNNSNVGYIVKLDSNGNVSWQKELTNTKIYGSYLKNDTTIFLTGITTTANLWVSQIDDTGNIQWQNQFDSNINFTVTNNYNKIVINTYINNSLLIGGTGGGSNTWFVTMIPDSGNIPGTGTYNFTTGNTLTYSIANIAISNANLVSSNLSNFAANNIFGASAGNMTLDTACVFPTTRTVAFIN